MNRQQQNELLDAPFPITSVCRSDIVSIGWTEEQVAQLTDMDMDSIAGDMCDDYLDQLFWEHLRYFVEQRIGKGKGRDNGRTRDNP